MREDSAFMKQEMPIRKEHLLEIKSMMGEKIEDMYTRKSLPPKSNTMTMVTNYKGMDSWR